ncbi:hypothetical protein [Phage f2b1]|nr:hypothetical protein [Phage f2b1]
MEIVLNALKFTIMFVLVFGGIISALALLVHASQNWSTRWTIALIALYVFLFSIIVQLDL